MGAIAEINLPKSAAMCTRCPYNIKTSSAAIWECTVSLQEDHIYEPSTRRSQPPKWQLGDGMTTRLFKTIYTKTELEEVLTWAQVALLNPSTSLEAFIPGTPEQARRKSNGEPSIEVEYSPNVVAVEIRGPGLPALSFYDLPGLINDAGTVESQFLVKVFDDLTIKYIKHESAIIICTRTMAADAALSKTNRLIRVHKAEHKCVGVLTMPDRMQGTASSHADFDGIFRGTLHRLPRGHYVTKQPGPDCKLDRNAPNYHALARQEEERFFDNEDSHWGPNGEWAAFRDRCGTSTIQNYLSKEFARQILASLPDLTQKIETQMQDVDKQLALLPETPNDKVQHIVRQHLTKFSTEVQKTLDGTSFSSNFHSDWTRLCHHFERALEIMRPICICSHPSDRIKEVIMIDDSDNESVSSHSQSSHLRRPYADITSPSDQGAKRRRFNDSPVTFTTPTKQMKRFKQEDPATPKQLSPAVRRLKEEEIGVFRQPYLASGNNAMSIVEIQKVIEQHSKAGFPDFVSHRVRELFALQAIHFWDQPLKTFLDYTFSMVRDQILTILKAILQQYQHTDLYRRSLEYVEDFLRKHEKEQYKASMEFYTTEKGCLFTIDTNTFNRNKAEAYSILKAERRRKRLACYMTAHYHRKSSGDEEKDRKDREDFAGKIRDDQLGPDLFDREIEVAAYIRGYYTTARLRFTDSICINLYSRFFRTIAQKIDYFLEEKFELDNGDGEAICQVLLEGSPEIAQKRAGLRKRKAQLVEFSSTLEELKNDTFDGGVDDDVSSETTTLNHNGYASTNDRGE